MADDKDLKHLLCELEVPSTIKFSPNAQQVLYSTNLQWEHRKGKHTVSTLWLVETGKANSARQISSGLFKDHAPRWNPDGQSIAFISDRQEAGKKWAIYVQHVRNGVVEGEAHPITDVENERAIPKFEFSPDGKFIAYICADPKTEDEKAREEKGWDMDVFGENLVFNRIRIVDLATKKIQRATGSADIRSQPEKHVMGFAWSPDSQHLAVVSAKSPHIEEEFLTGSPISILHPQSSSIHDVCKLPSSARDITWANDGNIYFIFGEPVDKTEAGQALYSLTPKITARGLYEENVNYTRVAFGKDNDINGLINAAGDVVARVQCGLYDHLCLLSDRVVYDKPLEIEAFDAAYTADSDEMVLAIATSDINNPVEVFTTTASGGASVQLSNHGAALKNRSFGSCKFISCPSLDKEVTLDGIFLAPSGVDSPPSNPLPTVVLIHGGPADRNTNRFNTYYYYWSPYLLSLGYGVLLINYRGSTGKGSAFSEYSTQGVGQFDWEDVIAMTNHAIEEGYADKERVIVGGWSQGGYLSFACSVRNGLHPFDWSFKAAIPGAGASDTDAMALSSDMGGWSQGGYLSFACSVRNGLHPFDWSFKAAIPGAGASDTDAMALSSDMGGTVEGELNGGKAPWNQNKDFVGNRKASPIWEFHEAMVHAKKTGKIVVPPMLILHGEKDERIPISQAWGMRRALDSEKLPYEFVTYPRQPHNFTEQNFWIDMLDRIGRWCEKHIGPGEKINEGSRPSKVLIQS